MGTGGHHQEYQVLQNKSVNNNMKLTQSTNCFFSENATLPLLITSVILRSWGLFSLHNALMYCIQNHHIHLH